MSIKLLHIADTHIGMENYGRLDTVTGLHSRVRDFIKCLKFAFETAIKEKVDLIIFAGDAYKTCDPSSTHQREFAAQIRTLSSAGIPLVMIVGNHDNPVSFGKASSLDIFGTLGVSDVHIITKPRLLKLRTKSGLIQVACLPWPTRSQLLTRSEYKDLSEEEITGKIQDICTDIIDNFADELDPNIPSVLVAHLAAADATYSGSERSTMVGRDPTFLTGVLANPAFDHVCLGHVHKFQDLNPRGNPHVVYSGSIERVNFGEEKEEKGFCLVTIKDTGHRTQDTEGLSLFNESNAPVLQQRQTSYQFVRTPARPFITVEVTVGEDQDPTEAILEEIGRHDLRDTVVRVIYTIPEGSQNLVDLKAINSALKDAFLVSSIVPKIQIPQRIRRAEVSEDLGLREALERYIENNPDLGTISDDLKIYAAELERELERE